jgi:hypothetical protein
VRNPVTTPVDNRPARFLRIEKAVSLPDDETLEDLPGTAFGAAGALGMREILGYAMIEPDGSVQVKVPANVAFAISILDRNGRRVANTPRHFSWLQVRAGETVTCNGCHNPGADSSGVTRPHGRAGLTTAVNTGAAAAGPFPSSEAALSAQIGETMAETRMRVSCETNNCVALKPSVNVVFDDVWTDPLVTAKAPSFAMLYAELNTPPPVGSDCPTRWTAQCRITIHYPTHLQPIWDLARVTLDAGGAVVSDHTCTRCHGPVDAAAAAQVPAGQLNLTSAPSADEPDHYTSFRKLLFAHNEQILQGGVLVDRLVDGPIDPVTMLPTQVPVSVAAPMVGGSAAASTLFFSCFQAAACQRGAGTVDHRGFLTPGELRLLSEWLDIGAQYYNDPFAVPVN